jgi:hypothetical protein
LALLGFAVLHIDGRLDRHQIDKFMNERTAATEAAKENDGQLKTAIITNPTALTKDMTWLHPITTHALVIGVPVLYSDMELLVKISKSWNLTIVTAEGTIHDELLATHAACHANEQLADNRSPSGADGFAAMSRASATYGLGGSVLPWVMTGLPYGTHHTEFVADWRTICEVMANSEWLPQLEADLTSLTQWSFTLATRYAQIHTQDRESRTAFRMTTSTMTPADAREQLAGALKTKTFDSDACGQWLSGQIMDMSVDSKVDH